MKYSKELLEELVKKSLSIADVLRFLNLPLCSGGIHSHISSKIKKYGINTSHFLGVRANCGANHKGGPRRRTAQEILVLKPNGSPAEKTETLRRALKEIGVEYKCKECGLGPIWREKKLVLQIEHKNGNRLDDRPSNIDILCPNCHTQTETYGKIKSVLR